MDSFSPGALPTLPEHENMCAAVSCALGGKQATHPPFRLLSTNTE